MIRKKKLSVKLGSAILLTVFLSLVIACAKPAPAPTASPTTPSTPTPTPPPVTTPVKPIKLSLAVSISSTTRIYNLLWVPYMQEIEKGTNGLVKFEAYPSETLTKNADAYRSVVEGITDVSFTNHSITPGRFPLISVMDLALMGTTMEGGTKMLQELYQKFPEIQKEHADVHLLNLAVGPPVQVHTSKKQVTNLETIKGMKIGGTGANAAVADMLGAVGVVMSAVDFYPSLERGVVDGVVLPWAVVNSFKLNEVLKYHTVANLGVVTQWFAMNPNTWNKLPPQAQKVVNDVSAKLPDFYLAGAGAETQGGIDTAKELKHVTLELPAAERAKWVALAKPTWDKWAADKEAKGLPGKAVLEEAIKLADKYK